MAFASNWDTQAVELSSRICAQVMPSWSRAAEEDAAGLTVFVCANPAGEIHSAIAANTSCFMQGCYRKSGNFLRGKAEEEIFAVLGFTGVSCEEEQAASKAAAQADQGGLVPFAVAGAQLDAGAVIFLEQIGEAGVVRLVALVKYYDGDRGLGARVRFERVTVDEAGRRLAGSMRRASRRRALNLRACRRVERRICLASGPGLDWAGRRRWFDSFGLRQARL